MSPIIELDNLTKTFTRRSGSFFRPQRTAVVALDQMSFTVEPGESVGYIGANGAGKSTTIKMLVGILRPSNGSVRACGLDPLARRIELARQVGVVFGQRSQLWWDLPLAESFRILGAIHGLSAADLRARTKQLVQTLEMADTLATPVRQLSLGQRMRAEVAAALLHRPRLLILDEPTIALDVVSKQRLREFLLAERAQHGTTLLLTTHDMGDVERLCERLLVVDHGRLVFDGNLPQLTELAGAQRMLVVDFLKPVPSLTDLPGCQVVAVEGEGIRHRLAFDARTCSAAQIFHSVSQAAPVRDFAIEEPEIEDVVARIYRQHSTKIVTP